MRQWDVRNVQELFVRLASWRKGIWEWCVVLLLMEVIGVAYFSGGMIRNGGMVPAITTRDHLIYYMALHPWYVPSRGEIVRYRPPNGVSNTGITDWRISRVIGLPGEVIAIDRGVVFINGRPLNEPYVKEKAAYSLAATRIPKDAVYMLADARNHTFADSHNIGPVPLDKVDGTLLFCWFPLSRIKLFSAPKYQIVSAQ